MANRKLFEPKSVGAIHANPHWLARSYGPCGGKKSNGGGLLRWRGDGKELFYVSEDLKMMAAEGKEAASSEKIASVKSLFTIEYVSVSAVNVYSATAGGQRIVVETPSGAPGSTPVTRVVNWPGEVEKK